MISKGNGSLVGWHGNEKNHSWTGRDWIDTREILRITLRSVIVKVYRGRSTRTMVSRLVAVTWVENDDSSRSRFFPRDSRYRIVKRKLNRYNIMDRWTSEKRSRAWKSWKQRRASIFFFSFLFSFLGRSFVRYRMMNFEDKQDRWTKTQATEGGGGNRLFKEEKGSLLILKASNYVDLGSLGFLYEKNKLSALALIGLYIVDSVIVQSRTGAVFDRCSIASSPGRPLLGRFDYSSHWTFCFRKSIVSFAF